MVNLIGARFTFEVSSWQKVFCLSKWIWQTLVRLETQKRRGAKLKRQGVRAWTQTSEKYLILLIFNKYSLKTSLKRPSFQLWPKPLSSTCWKKLGKFHINNYRHFVLRYRLCFSYHWGKSFGNCFQGYVYWKQNVFWAKKFQNVTSKNTYQIINYDSFRYWSNSG